MGAWRLLCGVLACSTAAATAACSLVFGFDHFGDGAGAPCVGPCDSGNADDVGEEPSPTLVEDAGSESSVPGLDARADAGVDAAIADAPPEAEEAGGESGADANETGPALRVLGCFQDSMTRDLPYVAYASPVATDESCVHACAVHGFLYAGTQAGSQCFCGNAFGGQGPAGQCDQPCNGDSTEICGGVYENSVFAVTAKFPPKPAYVGCFADNSSRDLPYSAYGSSYATIETCALACAYYGYAYAGAQAGGQCFCGETYGGYGPSNNCTSPCTGAASEVCGGGYANSVYRTWSPLDAGPALDAGAD
jgi:hypothetical protein